MKLKTVHILAVIAIVELIITKRMTGSITLFFLYGIYVVARDDL